MIQSLENKKNFQRKAGFTLVELLIAMGIFVVVIGISSSIFIQSFRSQRSLVSLIAVNSNASLTMEQMARELRTGVGFPDSGGNSIAFTNSVGEAVTYQHNSSQGSVERNGKKITADNIWVSKLDFSIFKGSSAADIYPARITIVLQVGTPRLGSGAGIANLQTTVSARSF